MRAALLALLLLPATAVAQEASPYLPTSHWTMPYLEHLIAAGRIADPSPLSRPFTVAAIARALDAVDSNAVTRAEWTVVQRIKQELERRMRGPSSRLDVHAGIAAGTYDRRDPLREAGGGPGHATFSGGAALTLYFGHAVLVAHPYFDTRLKFDPDWYGKKDRVIAGRNEAAYISAQFGLGEVFFGSLDRNWGPPDVQGLLLSDSPYGFDHLAVSLGTSGLRLEGLATQLNDLTDSTGAIHNRFMVQHRLLIHPPGRWTVAAWEGSVLSGVGRQLEPWYFNFLNPGILTQWNTNTNVNSFVGLDLSRQGAVTVFAQAMLDDIQVDRKTPADRKPSSYGFTLGARGHTPRALSGGAWRLFYTQVANLTYRNEDNTQTPIYFGLGTGRNFSDYDQLSLKLSVVLPRTVLLEPEITLLRQGEGDLHFPHPAVAAYDSTPMFLSGVVTRTLRLALAGRVATGRWTLAGNGGVHLIANADHVAGASKTRFVGTMQLSWRTKREGRIP
ncbi:MAG TPA: hypothetical protein VL549_11450 [Gemmatimonadales bacterium]|nr:hypothetical protein [Gemmatimonadales bacterium]